MRITVFGASGYVGSHLVPMLADAGHEVRAVSRQLAVLEGRDWPDVDLVEADALAPETLGRALEGTEAVYYLVHSMGGGRGFAERDRRAAANVAEAAARAGVARIIYLGGLRPAGAASAHLRSRIETGDTLRKGPVPVTELRAGIIVGAGSAGFEVIRDLVNHLPVMVTPRWVDSRTQPIALRDLLAYLAGVLDRPETAGQTYDVAGPEVLRYRDLLLGFARATDKRRLLVPVPVLSPRLSSYWLDLVTSVPVSIARPLIDGLKHDLAGDDRAIRAILPIPLQTYDEAIRSALEEERQTPLAARWSEGALAFRGWDAETSFYAKRATTPVEVDAPAAATWRVVTSIGGERGYFYANPLWRLRGAMDRAIGGIGMRRGRRHPDFVRVGDTIDFWRVAAVEPGRRLTLVAEMRLPGAAVQQWDVEPLGPDRSRLTMTASFHPSGIFGLLYWYALAPAHLFIFQRMPRNMARTAERLARTGQPG